HFKTRIEDYDAVLESWARAVPAGLITYHASWPLDTYLARVKELLRLKTSQSDEELFPSRDFSVNAAALGSVTLFERHEPERLEDFFTLIHQSLNVVAGAFLKNAV